MNQLARLILEHLDKAGGNMLPEPLLFSELRQMVRPVATEEQWTDAILELIQRNFIGFKNDEIGDYKKFFIREAGQTALRRA